MAESRGSGGRPGSKAGAKGPGGGVLRDVGQIPRVQHRQQDRGGGLGPGGGSHISSDEDPADEGLVGDGEAAGQVEEEEAQEQQLSIKMGRGSAGLSSRPPLPSSSAAALKDYHSTRDVLQQQRYARGAAGAPETEPPPKAAPSTEPLRWVPLEKVGSGKGSGVDQVGLLSGITGWSHR